MTLSYWERETFFNNVNIIIIGSGIVGLSSALYLRKKYPTAKILVLERGALPSGASSKNAGFACFGSPSEIIDDIEKYGQNETFNILEKRWKGLARLRSLLGDENIGYEHFGSYEVFTDESSYNTCNQNLKHLNQILQEITGIEQNYSTADKKIQEFGIQNVKHLIWNKGEGQINTGKMIYSLIKKCQQENIIILNGMKISHVEDIENGVTLSVNDFKLKANKLLIATNGFARQLLPELNVNPARAQVVVTSPIENLKIKGTFHYEKGYYYFRNVGDRILFGGGRNLDFKGEETYEFGLTDKIQQSLEKILKETILPESNYEIEHRWSGIMGVGDTKSTIVKSISKNVVCAVRMGGMGVAIGTLIGEEASELVNL
jgi:gamma-glutamylputrescine oxidase